MPESIQADEDTLVEYWFCLIVAPISILIGLWTTLASTKEIIDHDIGWETIANPWYDRFLGIIMILCGLVLAQQAIRMRRSRGNTP